MLTKRLAMCAELVSGYGIACDVGTDHAYLATELLKSGKCKRVIASDVAEGPLNAAKRTLIQTGFIDSAELILSDGLLNVSSEGVTDVVIAGMGGETIVRILEACSWVKNNSVNLILQPMTKISFLRKWLCENGFEIVCEKIVCEGRFFYTIMKSKYDGKNHELSEFEMEVGKLDWNDNTVKNYGVFRYSQLKKIFMQLREVKTDEAEVYRKLMHEINIRCNAICKVEKDMITVGDVYKEINSIAPFCTQEKWDNSGLLVGDANMPAEKIYVSLDISNESVLAAKNAGAQLMISHHPVIFSPLKSFGPSDPVWKLAAANMAAICVHTPLDIADEGINAKLYEILREKLFLGEIKDSLCGSGFGWIAECSKCFAAVDMAEILKDILGCTVVRYCDCGRSIRRIALCSGSGGSFLSGIINQQCDAFITGDVKHDLWYTAKNAGISLFDCGHYHTEKIAVELLTEKLKAAFPDAEIICDNGGDPVMYAFGGRKQ